MTLLLVSVGVLLSSGLLALLAGPRARIATAVGACGAVAGAGIGLIPAGRIVVEGASDSLRLPWHVPQGAFYVEIDALSAFFLIPVLALSAIAGVYGAGYMSSWRGKKLLGPPWFFFNWLLASMVLVLVARNGVLFLVAWEVMTLASYFLVTFEDEKESVREAGRVYLIAMHLGTAFLLVLFILLGQESGSLDFDRFTGAAGRTPAAASLLFMLAVIGFGTKAGLMPLHVWLPEAHPAAPSHVSGVMSAVMIKTGIYGLLRTLGFLGPPQAWWGWFLVAAGLCSGVLGILFALAQRDMKRLLAYSSVENAGIITLGIGIGLIGSSAGAPVVALLGFAGALLHVLNHALFKGLLFLSAGSILHGARTRDIERLGGLSKRMPWTSGLFLLAAAAISALPPLNGFSSEFLIYLGAFHGASAGGSPAIPAMASLTGLALLGGLSAACFAKAFGMIFLGEPRSEEAARAHEPGLLMRFSMTLLAIGCVAAGFLSPAAIGAMKPVLAAVTGMGPEAMMESLPEATGPLSIAVGAGGGFAALVVLLALLRRTLLRGRQVESTVTWDCGYARPSSRMQYTGSSFTQPLTDLFGGFLRAKRILLAPVGLFPGPAFLDTHTPDLCREGMYRPLGRGITWVVSRLRWLQQGRVQLYVLYIALTLLVLLIWKLG